MKTVILILTIASVVMFVAGSAISQHYYGGGNTIGLKIDSNRITIRFDETIPILWYQSLIDTIGRIEAVLQDDHAIDGFIVCSLSTSQGYDEFMDSINTSPVIDLVEPYYRDDYDSAFLVGQKFCVAFLEDMTQAEIDSINVSYGVIIDYPVPYMPNVFVLRNSKATGMRMLDLANMYYDLGATRYSHPNFSVRPVLNSYQLYDYFSGNQPHTKKVIGQFNQAAVWDFAGLENQTIVAVIDDGVTSHEDLPAARVLPGYDFAGASAYYNDGDDDPSPGSLQGHGMGVAGIIGASHTTDSVAGLQTSSGVLSLNGNTLIMPVKIIGDNGAGASGGDVQAAAISYAWQNGADVLSNSWTYPTPTSNYDVLNDAIDRATLFGRNGRGCPVIFGSGNNSFPFSGQVGYPANLPSTFAVGATRLNDTRWYYSQYGPTLDIVAPSGDISLQGDVWTMDQMGTLGWNPAIMSNCPSGSNNNGYDCKFGGTSAATPVVSGTASLLLAKDSTLSAQAVYYILRNSAVTDLDWGTITPPHVEYGYGRVDAFRAVLSISHGNANNLIGPGGPIDVSDVTFLVAYLFQGGSAPFPSVLLADMDCNTDVNVDDLTYLTNFLFQGGPQPVKPCFKF